jgi:hypothetical protein
MGVAHENELCVAKLGYHVDIAILPIAGTAAAGGGASGQPLDKVDSRATENVTVRAAAVERAGIVIEVDGPTHYDDERRLRPASEVIWRHLALAGWAVLGVPYWEWDALEGRARKAEYLAKLLERAASKPERS